jgi:cation diffusion facilitator CzcD-associated flavoprotein CzcO
MRCAIVGSGLAALAAYATLRRRGVAAEEIVVFGTDADPTAAWRSRAQSIRQKRMRSESDGHVAPAAFPGLAVREAVRHGSAAPLLASVTNRYHPTVDDFVSHARAVCGSSGWERSFVERRIARVRAVDGGFELDGEGPFPHVLLATGHPGLARIPGTVHAYEPHEYAAKVAVVGAGMAAATEWLNALAAGAEVTSIRRREPLRRPLNVPREYFSRRGLASFHRTTTRMRAALLEDLGRPSYPPGREWDEPLEKAAAASRFRVSGSSPTELGQEPDADRTVPGDLQIIAATGFLRGWQNDPLLADLVAAHDLETHDRWIVLESDSTVPTLTNGRTLAIAGVAGQWAFPAADTIAGAKYAARAFANRVCRTR